MAVGDIKVLKFDPSATIAKKAILCNEYWLTESRQHRVLYTKLLD
jgi:hypothetical protein